MMTRTSPTKDGFFIEVGCPGCGGALELQADFFVTGCKHCGSPLRIVMPESPPAFMITGKVGDFEVRRHVDRHLKTQNQPLTGSGLHTKKLYYPYWKVEASVLKLRNRTETRKVYTEAEGATIESEIRSDRSEVHVSPYALTLSAAERINGIPETIGLRSETIRVLPLSEENLEDDFETIPARRSLEETEERVHKAVSRLSEINPADFGRNLTRLFNPRYSLVYFPFIVAESYGSGYRRFILDGLTGRVIAAVGEQTEQESAEPDPLAQAPEIEQGKLQVEFHRCTVCGEDLPTELSHVYICGNCHELQRLDTSSNQLSGIEAASVEQDENDRMVPFWRLHLPEIMSGPYANLLGGIDRNEYLYIPATGSHNFEAMHKAACRTTAAQSRIETDTIDSFDARFLPIRIGLSEAIALAEMIVCRELLDHGHQIPDQFHLTPQDYGLTYLPFHLENYFYLDSVINAIGFERALIE